jgi:hypothetical protein
MTIQTPHTQQKHASLHHDPSPPQLVYSLSRYFGRKVQRLYDMNGIFQMQGGPSMGSNGGSVATDSAGARQTDRKKNLVWFGEIEGKLAKLSMPTFTYCSSS